MIKLIIIFTLLFCFSCTYSDNNSVNLYEKALLNENDIHADILYNENYDKYHNKQIKINGYIDGENNRLYMDELFDGLVPFHESTTLVLDVKISDLLGYTCPITMVQIEATYKHIVIKDSEKQLLVDVVKISAYDTTPKDKGGKGELTVCWEY